MCRWTYPDFFSRYWVLMRKSDLTSADKKQVCKNLLETLIKVRHGSDESRLLLDRPVQILNIWV